MKKDKKINVFNNFIIKFVVVIFSTIGIISLATIVALNSTFIYREIISKYNLAYVTGVNTERLMINYKGLIHYLQNPFISKLKFEDFIMSNTGEIHFYEVKKIFLIMLVITIIFIIGIIVVLILSKYRKIEFFEVIKVLNTSANIVIIFFATLVTIFLKNFSWGFITFHKIFFRNNYWVFDPVLDPIINALPEELFFIYGSIILGIILITAIAIKVIYYKNKRK